MFLTKDIISRQEKRIQMEKHELAESRLHEQIKVFKKDLNDRMDRLEKRLQWIVTTAVVVTSIVTAIIVNFL